MSVEQRLRDTLAQFDSVEPAPDLFGRVQRSVAEDQARRRRLGRTAAAIAVALSVSILAVAGSAAVSSAGTIVVEAWPLVVVETGLLSAMVVAFGPLIRRFGSVFVEDVFGGSSEGVGFAFLRLLDLAYYLLFAGYVILTLPVSDLGGRRALVPMLEMTFDRFGGLVLLMGVMHAVTITALPLVGLIHASTVREHGRTAMESPPAPTPGAAFAERVVRIVLWSAGGLVILLVGTMVLNLVAGIILSFDG